MAKRTKLTFTFVNPNSEEEFRRGFAKIVVDKLLSQYRNLNYQPISKDEGDGKHPPTSPHHNTH